MEPDLQNMNFLLFLMLDQWDQTFKIYVYYFILKARFFTILKVSGFKGRIPKILNNSSFASLTPRFEILGGGYEKNNN